MLIEPLRMVILNSQREHIGFPRRGWKFKPIEQFDDRLEALRPFGTMLLMRAHPRQQKALKLRDRHRLNFCAQPIYREPVNSGQQTAVAPFQIGSFWMEFSSQDKPFGFQSM